MPKSNQREMHNTREHSEALIPLGHNTETVEQEESRAVVILVIEIIDTMIATTETLEETMHAHHRLHPILIEDTTSSATILAVAPHPTSTGPLDTVATLVQTKDHMIPSDRDKIDFYLK